MNEIQDLTKTLISKLNSIESLDDKIEALNYIKKEIAKASPFTAEPVDVVQWIPFDKIESNSWNPNSVAPPEMKLLYGSIKSDGYTQPIVAYRLSNGKFQVVDGFHRNRVGKEHADIGERIHGHLPVVVIEKDLNERMASTIRHNRARGKHSIDGMVNIVAEMKIKGWSDMQIAKELGMDADEVLRLMQSAGLPELFKDHEYSRSWI